MLYFNELTQRERVLSCCAVCFWRLRGGFSALYFYRLPRGPPNDTRDLKIRRRRRQRERERHKSNSFNEQNNNFSRASNTFLYICRFCTTTKWKCLISCFIEDEIFFLFLTLDKALKNSTPGEFAYIRQRKRYGIIAMKFEKPRISSWRH